MQCHAERLRRLINSGLLLNMLAAAEAGQVINVLTEVLSEDCSRSRTQAQSSYLTLTVCSAASLQRQSASTNVLRQQLHCTVLGDDLESWWALVATWPGMSNIATFFVCMSHWSEPSIIMRTLALVDLHILFEPLPMMSIRSTGLWCKPWAGIDAMSWSLTLSMLTLSKMPWWSTLGIDTSDTCSQCTMKHWYCIPCRPIPGYAT